MFWPGWAFDKCPGLAGRPGSLGVAALLLVAGRGSVTPAILPTLDPGSNLPLPARTKAGLTPAGPTSVGGGAALPAYQVVGPAAASFADETLLHHLRTGRTQSGARVGWVVPGPARVVGFELIDVDSGSARVPLLGGLCRVPQEW